MSRTIIRGITWDHPRGYAPLAGSIDAYRAVRPDVEIVWDRRSLKDFGEGPIDDLSERYDLIVVDHPFAGKAASTGYLRDMRPILGEAFIQSTIDDSIGQSAISYHYGNGVYGLPTDAAAQVAAYRPDVLQRVDADVPKTFEDILALAEKAKPKGASILVPAVPTDSFCIVLTLMANLDCPAREGHEFGDVAFVTDVIEKVARLVAACRPESLDMNPIAALDRMAAGDDVAYIPFTFGYTNYSRTSAKNVIRFANIAGPGDDPRKGSLLGGAGCAITRGCKNIKETAEYLRFLHDPGYLAGRYFADGGQPGSRRAWLDQVNDEAASGFFSGTMETLEKAYLRPRFDGFTEFFEESGIRMNAFLRNGGSSKAVAHDLIDRYAKAVEGTGTA